MHVFTFWVCAAALRVEVFVYLLIAVVAAEQDLHADIFLLLLRAGMCWSAGFEDNKAA